MVVRRFRADTTSENLALSLEMRLLLADAFSDVKSEVSYRSFCLHACDCLCSDRSIV